MSLSLVIVVSDGANHNAVSAEFDPTDSPEQVLAVALSKAGVVGFSGWEMTGPTGEVITGRGIATLAAVPVQNDSMLRVRRRAGADAVAPAAAAAAPPSYSAAMAGHAMEDLDGAVEGMPAQGGDDEGHDEGVPAPAPAAPAVAAPAAAPAPAAGLPSAPYDVAIVDIWGDGRSIRGQMRATDTVGLLKQRYGAARPIPRDCFLLCAATALDDDRARLCDVGLVPDDRGNAPTVYVVRRHVPDPARKFPLHVRTIEKREYTLEVDDTATVTDLKVLVALATSTEIDEQRLIFKGMQLDDGRTLRECGIVAKATLHLVLRMRGD